MRRLLRPVCGLWQAWIPTILPSQPLHQQDGRQPRFVSADQRLRKQVCPAKIEFLLAIKAQTQQQAAPCAGFEIMAIGGSKQAKATTPFCGRGIDPSVFAVITSRQLALTISGRE